MFFHDPELLDALDPHFGHASESAVLLALKNDRQALQRTFNMADVQEAKEDIIKTAHEITTDKTWDPKPTFLCKFYDYSDICPESWEKRNGGLVKIGRAEF